MKLSLIATMLMGALSIQAQKISVLGDSYSTFEGAVSPPHNLVWYWTQDNQYHHRHNDVDGVEQTWWHRVATRHGLTIEHNNSYSGATVCQRGYRGEDYSDRSFFCRVFNLGRPDIILIFGGTNDSWSGASIGGDVHEAWTNDTLYYFRPAFCHLLHLAKMLYPKAHIYNITNSELSADITDAMAQICQHYGITNIALHDIDKQAGHPSRKGMEAIEQQVWEVISRDL